MATTTPSTAANKAAEVNIKNYKKQIAALRKQLTNPMVTRNADRTQQIYDQIEELKRKIEDATRQTRRAVPITNAPVVGERQTRKTRRDRTHFSII